MKSNRTAGVVVASFVALSLAMTTGCINTLRVHRDKEKGDGVESIRGLPFYVKTERLTRTTTYARTWREVELEVEDIALYWQDGANRPTRESINKQTLRRFVDPQHEDQLSRIEALLVEGNEDAILQFLGLPDSVAEIQVPSRRIGNQLSSTSVVDYTRTHYVNAPLPWIGTSKLTPELAGDGTLTKVSVESEGQVGEILGAVVDAAETIVGFATPAQTSGAFQSMSLSEAERTTLEQNRAMRLRVQWVEERDVYTKTYMPGETVDPVLQSGTAGVDHRTERVGDKPTPKPEGPSSAYTFSGSVVPPKSK